MSLRFGEQDGALASGLIFGNQSGFLSTADVFGSGNPSAQDAVADGAGFRTAVDVGTTPEIESGLSTVSGVGEVTTPGTGDLLAQSAQVSGTGIAVSNISGVGVLSAQEASVAGVGNVGIGGVGALLAQSATVVGAGGLVGKSTGVGVLQAQDAIIVGVGERIIFGSGSADSGPSSISGAGFNITVAVPYTCYLPPKTIQFDKPILKFTYQLQFSNARNQPTSVEVGFDDLVTYHAGVKSPVEVAYQFSNDRNFVEDQD